MNIYQTYVHMMNDRYPLPPPPPPSLPCDQLVFVAASAIIVRMPKRLDTT
jgi:hypothetical protein